MADYQRDIQINAIKYIGEGGNSYIPGLVLLPAVTVFVYWASIPASWLIVWWLGSAVLTAYRIWAIRWIKAVDLQSLNVSLWRRRIAATSFVSGCLWGIAMVFFFDATTVDNQIYLLATIYGLTSISLVLGAYYPAGYYAFIFPCLFAVIVRLVLVGTAEHLAFAVVTCIYLVVLIKMVRRQNSMVESLMLLRFERLDLVAELRMQKSRAEQLSGDKTRFLAAASHDLRQPLHAISLFTAALDVRIQDTICKASLHKIAQSVASLECMLSALLDISKIDAGAVQPSYVHCRIAPILRRIADQFELDAQSKGLTLDVVEGDFVAITDPVMLETIFLNLVGNAIRYTFQGAIRVLCRKRGNQLVIVILDTGVGIPRAQQKNVFREFFRLTSEENLATPEGAGLGLATVLRLVSLLGYRLRMRSAPERGTCFFLRVPAGDSEKIAKPLSPAEGNAEEKNLAILVVDNNVEICHGMEALLSSWGHNVITAISVEQALKKLQESSWVPSLLIVDFHLGSIDGDNAAERLKEVLSAPYDMIMISGDGSDEIARKARQLGAKLLQKPVQGPILQAAIMHSIWKLQLQISNRIDVA
jgi:signal transduction histidine kinase/CheY-like chemotaxis protein